MDDLNLETGEVEDEEFDPSIEEKIDYIYEQMKNVEAFLLRAAQNPMLRAMLPKE